MMYGWPGSSPLTRGKHLATDTLPRGGGLIPAHAGKTLHGSRNLLRGRAHPRSRGENLQVSDGACKQHGSSPLTRGKRTERENLSVLSGLIPAHAGKTADSRTAAIAR